MKPALRKTVFGASFILLIAVGTVTAKVVLGPSQAAAAPSVTYNGYLEYLKSAHMAAPSDDPAFISLLMQQFGVLNRHEQGIGYLEALLDRHADSLTDLQRARYVAVPAQPTPYPTPPLAPTPTGDATFQMDIDRSFEIFVRNEGHGPEHGDVVGRDVEHFGLPYQ